jgi:acetyl esterase/lipase
MRHDVAARPGGGRRARLAVAAMWLAVVGAGCADRPSLVSTTDVEYHRGFALDVHAPDAAEELPVVVLLHGAGVRRGDYTEFATRLAGRGAVVFNADWDPLSTLEAGLEEVACSVRYARAHASELGGDAGRLVLVGHSTASAFAGRVAVSGDDVAGSCEITGSAFPNALALLAPAVIPGGRPWPYSELGRNPRLRVGVVHGVDDRVASPARGERTADVLRDAGYDTTFALVPGGHDDLVLVVRRSSEGLPSTPDGRAADLAIDVILDLVGPQPDGE